MASSFVKFAETAEAEILSQVKVPDRYYNRICTGLKTLDDIFGGDEMPGVMPGSTTLLTGFPGAGKSTFALQIADHYQEFAGRAVLYNGGEQTKALIKLMANRIGLKQNFAVSRFGEVDDLIGYCDRTGVEILFQDSLQSLADDDLEGNTKLLKVGKKLVEWALNSGVTVVLIGQITKAGEFAGPMQLKHDVDVHAHLSFNKDTGNRVFELSKNRFGPAMLPHEFCMSKNGLEIRELSEAERQETVKSVRQNQRKEAIITKAKEMLMAGARLSGYSLIDNHELSTYLDKEWGGVSGGFWRLCLEAACSQLEAEGHKVNKQQVDRRQTVFMEF